MLMKIAGKCVTSVSGPQEQVLKYVWGPQTNLTFDFRILNVFDTIFRKKLTGASILEWSKRFDPPSVSEEIIDVEKDASLQLNER